MKQFDNCSSQGIAATASGVEGVTSRTSERTRGVCSRRILIEILPSALGTEHSAPA
jgi:hypothetical protein